MPVAKVLLSLDTDAQPSTFDSIVAIDAGVDHLLSHASVGGEQVRGLVYGAIFTRDRADLRNTAIFIGGSDVAAGEELLVRARECFIGPLRVSVMLDPGGANTTAAAAVLSAATHAPLADQTVTVLAATGSVGSRAVRLLAGAGARVRVASRSRARAQKLCTAVALRVPDARLEPIGTGDEDSLRRALAGATVALAAGPPGVELISEAVRRSSPNLRVLLDLNVVPPVGIGGVEPQDKATDRQGQVCYGAIGVGELKMKLHRAAIGRLFEANDLVLDAEEIFALGESL